MIRHQLPVFSPLRRQALMGALGGRLQGGEDPRTALSELLAEERGAERAVLYVGGTPKCHRLVKKHLTWQSGQDGITQPTT